MRRLITCLVLLASLVFLHGSVLAQDPTPTPLPDDAEFCTDPADDTTTDSDETPSPGQLDIIKMAHGDTAETVTYELTTDEGYASETVGNIDWLIDADADEEFDDAAVRVNAGMQGSVTDGQGDEVATATVVHTDGSDKMLVEVPRDALEELGVADEYEYVVNTTESDEYRFDEGGPCIHDLDADEPTPTPTPGFETGSVILDSSTIPVGGTLSGYAPDFSPGTEATVTSRSHPVVLGTVTVDDRGEAQFSFPLPASVELGPHTVEVRGVGASGNARVATAGFTVVQAQVVTPVPGAATGDGLPTTGAGGLNRTVPAALVLLFGGLALVSLMAWHRRPAMARAEFCATCGKHLARQVRFCPTCGRGATY